MDHTIKDPPAHPTSKKGEPAFYRPGMAEEQSAAEAFADFGGLKLKVRLIFDVLTFDQRHHILEALGFAPVQQFFDENSGRWLKLHLYYGFHDAGGVAGEGYATREAAIAAIEAIGYERTAIGTKPEDVSDFGVTAVSCQELLDELKKRGLNISDFGRMA